jgi:PPE-repeat protein
MSNLAKGAYMPKLRSLTILGCSLLGAGTIAMVAPATSNAACLFGISGGICDYGILTTPTSTGILNFGPGSTGIANLGPGNTGAANFGALNTGLLNAGVANFGVGNFGIGKTGLLGTG